MVPISEEVVLQREPQDGYNYIPYQDHKIVMVWCVVGLHVQQKIYIDVCHKL